ncbi:hypothetical protein [Burkholderia pseudomallei]|uniref:hypothetical protein n=1 Tax=Burkholderia pseudomallei TaxID=28450 RepID=UPI001A9E5A8F|nr:hypothetical protein [Burkholderia pseudomallei]MBO7795456.1 hypothetical protein [Burkholderia pseudomallei]MBO7814009.1 hypothetical protein [Burkholderia pseudomallei]QTB44291.1 hypothetical protein J3B47_07090 [Burkholderia pseudomallei]QTB67341.1 hypothetical protein J3J51_00360 [Burkholderia pseudomallei]
MSILSYVLGAIFVVLCLVGAASVLWVIFFAARMIFQFSNSKDTFSRKTIWNPMNAIINPDVLSPKGLVSRKRVLRGSLVFVLAFALAGCIAVIFQILDKT